MISKKLPHIFYGGDYNPEQWSEEVWLEDIKLMKKAGVNLVSIGIFSWSVLQPGEDHYNFEWLDRLMDLLAENDIYADLATGTAAQPAWISKKYDDVLPVDEYGNKINYGSRQSYCPNSPSYRQLGQKLVRKLAERYKDHPALILWHINNEYGCHTSACYCDTCAEEFRSWLKNKYRTLKAVNNAWGTRFWSQFYYDWEEIIPPRATATLKNPGQELDYKRFMSDSLLECYKQEAEILREITPNIKLATNFMSDFKPLDYFKWAKEMDIVGFDCYPETNPDYYVGWAAFNYDLMRGLKGGKPFILMEQAPSQVQWRESSPTKRPGIMRQWSYQALARGADGIMFFQWRQSIKGAEKFHSGMITHTGNENSRVFKEVTQLGQELKDLSSLVDSKISAQVAILFDYENWWAVEHDTTPSNNLKYLEQIRNYYNPLFEANIPVDIISYDQQLSDYKIIIAPLMYMIKNDVDEKIKSFVEQGGTFITSFFSGIVDQTDTVFEGGYPGPLKEVLGIEVEEFDALTPGMKNKIEVKGNNTNIVDEYYCDLWCDIVCSDTAKILAAFEEDYYAGYPAVTENEFGAGKAYYLASQIEQEFMKDFLNYICQKNDIEARIESPAQVEVVTRHSENNEYIFILNHNQKEVEISLANEEYFDIINQEKVVDKLILAPLAVVILIVK
jgi:beta-galactosidase